MLDPVCLSSVFWRRHTSSYNVPAPFTLSPLDCWRTSNAGTWLSNATIRYLSLAERCHTQEFFILLKNEKNPKNEVKFEYFPDQFCGPPPIFFPKNNSFIPWNTYSNASHARCFVLVLIHQETKRFFCSPGGLFHQETRRFSPGGVPYFFNPPGDQEILLVSWWL